MADHQEAAAPQLPEPAGWFLMCSWVTSMLPSRPAKKPWACNYWSGAEKPVHSPLQEGFEWVPVFGADKMQAHRAAGVAEALAKQAAEVERLREAIATAYGHLWHVNNEPMAPVPLRSPEAAAYAARKALRDLLTTNERGAAINRVGQELGRLDAAIASGDPT
jgi:hypothetical protein